MDDMVDEEQFFPADYEFRNPDDEVMKPASPNLNNFVFDYDGEKFRDPIDDEINRIIEENYNPNVEENGQKH